jgi:hypothetical protein
MELGGIYFFVNALMNILSWLVAAALYSLYYPAVVAEPAHGVNVSTLVFTVNFSANVTGANFTGVPHPCSHATELMRSLCAPSAFVCSMLPPTPQVSTCTRARSATYRSSR